MEDFKKNSTSASPFLVITCYDELVRTKGVALIRGDIIGAITKAEGQAVLNLLMNHYLIDSQFEIVRQFNHEPNSFNIDHHTQNGLQMFKQELDVVTKPNTKPLIITPKTPHIWTP